MIASDPNQYMVSQRKLCSRGIEDLKEPVFTGAGEKERNMLGENPSTFGF